MRLAAAIVMGLIVSALGAIILGEYELVGVMPYVAAVLFALAEAELVTSIARRHDMLSAAAVVVLTGIGLAWAAWIQAARDWSYVPRTTWISVAVGAVVAAVWVRSFGRRGSSSPSDSTPPPAG